MLNTLVKGSAALIASTFFAISAQAATVKITGGETNIIFEQSALDALGAFHISATVSQGDFDVDTLTATRFCKGAFEQAKVIDRQGRTIIPTTVLEIASEARRSGYTPASRWRPPGSSGDRS